MFLAKVIRKTAKTSGLPKNSVVCILVVRFSSHVIHGMQHTSNNHNWKSNLHSYLTYWNSPITIFSKKLAPWNRSYLNVLEKEVGFLYSFWWHISFLSLFIVSEQRTYTNNWIARCCGNQDAATWKPWITVQRDNVVLLKGLYSTFTLFHYVEWTLLTCV